MAAVYKVDASILGSYARNRAEAMLLRDEQGDKQRIEPNWNQIEDLLRHSWQALHESVRKSH